MSIAGGRQKLATGLQGALLPLRLASDLRSVEGHTDEGPHAKFMACLCVTFAVLNLVDASMKRKTETLNLRVSPELKELIRLAADREHRTLANFIEVLVRKHCDEEGIRASQKQPQSR